MRTQGDDVHQIDVWHPVTFQNSWENYNPGVTNAAYRKGADGSVEIRGLVKNGVINTPIFTLPPGYRPAKQLNLPTASNGGFAHFSISVDGTVIPANGSNVWFSLDVGRFRTD